MRYDELNIEHKDYIRKVYADHEEDRSKAQLILSEYFGVTTRSIRNWANNLGLLSNEYEWDKVLIYDLETSRVKGEFWWPGKQYVRWDQLHEDPRIITVAWKWLGEDKVHTLRWKDVKAKPKDPDYPIHSYGCDRELVKQFADVYNQADLAIGVNSDNFDKRFLAQRCLVHREPFNRFVKSLDIQKAQKREFRSPSYSMKYSAITMGVEKKREHQGISMWREAQYHKDKEVRKEAVDRMEEYNIGDILTTEEMYLELIPYIDHKIHFGTLSGGEKFTCPNCGNLDTVEKIKTTSTKAGTIQHIMRCNDDNQVFKISNRAYTNYLQEKLQNKFTL